MSFKTVLAFSCKTVLVISFKTVSVVSLKTALVVSFKTVLVVFYKTVLVVSFKTVSVVTRGSCSSTPGSWPFNGTAGILVSMVGDVSVTIFDATLSIPAGTNLHQYVESLSARVEKEDKKQIAKSLTTVLVKEGGAVFVPFGCVHYTIPVPTKRESLTQTPEKKNLDAPTSRRLLSSAR